MYVCVSTLRVGQAVPKLPPEGSLRFLSAGATKWDTDAGFQVITLSMGPPGFLCLKVLEVQGVLQVKAKI